MVGGCAAAAGFAADHLGPESGSFFVPPSDSPSERVGADASAAFSESLELLASPLADAPLEASASRSSRCRLC
ncbi:hypothetical protein BJF85_05175 [Saccharomonospora sp. CUA-673]|nr:hypothetical protein BJF85_05175 [Saccharomonospora sp. CUA-673]